MNSPTEGQQIAECCKNYDTCRKSAVKSGQCEHKYSLKVIDEFHEVYRKRMKQLNEANDNSPELAELKIKTLQDWVEDLTEQNSLLAATLEELEVEAIAKANTLSRTSSDFSRTLNSFHDSSFSDRKLELRDSDTSQKYSGISLDEIDRLRMENEELKLKYSKKEIGFEKYRMCVEKLLERVDQPLYSDECYLKSFSGGDNQRIVHPQSHNGDLSSKLEECKNQIKFREKELNLKELELKNLKQLIEEKNKLLSKNAEEIASLQETAEEVSLLKAEVEKNRKNFHETRMSLAMEVASKHDQNLKLKHEIQLFEEQVRQSEMSTHFKDDIIKELRKELKIARSKEKNDECLSQLQSKIDLLSMQLKTKNDLICQLEMKHRLEKNCANPSRVVDDQRIEELKQRLKEKENRISELEREFYKIPYNNNNNQDKLSTSICNEPLRNSINELHISPGPLLKQFEEYYKLSEDESILFVNLFKENENATKLSQERENQVIALDEKFISMSKLLHEILVSFEKMEESNLVDEGDSEDSSQIDFWSPELHNSLKAMQQNLKSILASLSRKDFDETGSCSNLLLNTEKVFEQVQTELLHLKEGYSSHKNQTEVVYDAYRKIQKSLKNFIDHFESITKCCLDLKNPEFNERMRNHQNRIHVLKQELQETRRRKEDSLKIIKQFLKNENTSYTQENDSALWKMNNFLSLANESCSKFQNIRQEINLIFKALPFEKKEPSDQDSDSDVEQIKENIYAALEQLQSINEQMISTLEHPASIPRTPAPPLKPQNISRIEHGNVQSSRDEAAVKQNQATNTENENEDSERRLSKVSIELEHTQALLRNSEQDMDSRLQDFENYKSCAEKLIDDLKSQVIYLKRFQDNSAVIKLESKVANLEKEKEVFIKTIECQNKELARIKQQLTIAQEEKNAALIEKSIAVDELKDTTSFINEKLNSKDTRIKELSSMLDQSQQCVNNLQREIETLHSNSDFVMEKLRKDLCEITVNLKERDTLLNQREECIDSLHESIRLLEMENKDLKKEIDNLVKQKEKYIEFEEKLLDAQDKIMLLETEKVSSKHRAVSTSDHGLTERLKSYKSYFETLHGNLTACIEQASEEKERVKRLQETNINTAMKVYELEQDYQMCNRKLKESLYEIRLLEEKIKSLENSLSDNTKEVCRLQQLLKENENCLHIAQSTVKKYEDKIEALLEENESITMQSEEMQEKIRTLSEETNSLKKKNDDLNLKNNLVINEINRENKINQMLRQRIEEIKESKNQELANQIQKSESIAKDLQRKVSELLKTNTTLENNFLLLQKELNSFQLQDESTSHSIDNVEVNGKNQTEIILDQLKLIKQSYNKIAQRFLEYKHQLETRESEIVTMSEAFENMKSKCIKKTEELMNQVQMLKDSNALYQSENITLKDNVKDLNSQISESLKREEAAKNHLSVKDSSWYKKLHDNEQEVVQLRNLLSSLRNDYSKRSAELAQEQANHAATETKLKAVSVEIARFQKALKSKDETIIKVQGGMTQLTNKLVSYFQEITEKAELVSSLQGENSRLKSQLESILNQDIQVGQVKGQETMSCSKSTADESEEPSYLIRIKRKIQKDDEVKESPLMDMYSQSLMYNPSKESPYIVSASSSKNSPVHRQKSNLTQKLKTYKQKNAQLLKDKEILERINDQLISEISFSNSCPKHARLTTTPSPSQSNEESDRSEDHACMEINGFRGKPGTLGSSARKNTGESMFDDLLATSSSFRY